MTAAPTTLPIANDAGRGSHCVQRMVGAHFEDSQTRIINADCLNTLEEMEDASCHAIITDPPFSSGARTDAGKNMRGGMQRGAKWQENWFSHDNLATHGFNYLMRLVAVELYRVTTPTATAHFFIDWRMYPNLYAVVESAGWIAKNLVVWDKKHFGMGGNYRNQHELILYCEKTAGADFRQKNLGNVISSKRAEMLHHPTEKPTDILGLMIRAVTDEGQTVLDPFMGSGSTLRAAKDNNRKSIGIEICREYCEVAAARMAQTVLPLDADAMRPNDQALP